MVYFIKFLIYFQFEHALKSFLTFQRDADGLCTALGEPLPARKTSSDTPHQHQHTTNNCSESQLSSQDSFLIDKSVFEEAGWVINGDDITVSNSQLITTHLCDVWQGDMFETHLKPSHDFELIYVSLKLRL